MAYRCDLCGKGKLITKIGRHHRGVAGGKWKHRAPKTRRVLLPNLHAYQGRRFCTKCLRIVKEANPVPKKSPAVKTV